MHPVQQPYRPDRHGLALQSRDPATPILSEGAPRLPDRFNHRTLVSHDTRAWANNLDKADVSTRDRAD
jgi:hypothetical protein